MDDIKSEMKKKLEYVLERDDRTFSNQETDRGHYTDGYYQCYKDVLEIIDKHIEKNINKR